MLFIGTARGIENRLVPAAGFSLRLIEVGALNRVSLATRLENFLRLATEPCGLPAECFPSFSPMW